MKYKVCVVTGTRAEFGLLYPLLKRIEADHQLELQLVVTGTHLLNAFGNTENEIIASGIPIYARIPIEMGSDSKTDMAVTTGKAMSAFAEYFSENRPDLMIVLGDRYEIFAAATAAALQNVPIAHIHGGETTEGAVDEFLRHSITKMSYLHFTACEEYRRRVIQLGEDPERVFNVGALGVENVMNLPEMSLQALSEDLGVNLSAEPYSIVTFHPVTQDEGNVAQDMAALISAMERFPEMKFIITKANADAGGRQINAIWDAEKAKHDNWIVVTSLGAKRYLSALKHAQMMIGNSSSGILEAPAAHVPTVNIGMRQQGRMMADSVICCDCKEKDIVEAIQNVCIPEFREKVKEMSAPFGDGNTSIRILEKSKQYLQNKRGVLKSFYDFNWNY